MRPDDLTILWTMPPEETDWSDLVLHGARTRIVPLWRAAAILGWLRGPAGAVALKVSSGAAITSYQMPWAGAIIGISAEVEADRTGGSCSVKPTIGGTAQNLEAKIDDDPVRRAYATAGKDSFQFAAGALIGAKVTTDASWAAGSTPEAFVTVYVQGFLSET